MSNLMLAWPNLADSAALSSGSWSAGLPLNNLKNRLISKAARSTNALAASTKFDADLGEAMAINAVGLIGTNLTTAATYRIRGASDAGFTSVLHDSGTVSAATQTPNLIHAITAAITARYWRVELTDTANPAGYVQAGRLFIGAGWQAAVNASFGTGLGYESATVMEQSLGGVDYPDKRTPRRVFRFDLDWLTDAEAYTQVLAMQQQLDVWGEVLLIADPADTTYRQQRNFLARMRQLSAVEAPYAVAKKTAYELLEII